MKKIFFFIFSLYCLAACSNTDQRIVGMKSEEVANQSGTIIALGDSLTAGYGLSIEQSYPNKLEKILEKNGYNYKVINSGVSGNTSNDLLARLTWALEGIETPQIALVVIGGNDGLRSSSLETLETNIKAIIETLQSKNIQVVLGGMQIPPNLGRTYSRDFKNMYTKIAKEKKVFLIPFFLEGVAANSKLNLSDMIHPNEAGYAIIAQNVFDFLLSQKLLGLR